MSENKDNDFYFYLSHLVKRIIIIQLYQITSEISHFVNCNPLSYQIFRQKLVTFN